MERIEKISDLSQILASTTMKILTIFFWISNSAKMIPDFLRIRKRKKGKLKMTQAVHPEDSRLEILTILKKIFKG